MRGEGGVPEIEAEGSGGGGEEVLDRENGGRERFQQALSLSTFQIRGRRLLADFSSKFGHS
jgi:hypothetical protein